MRAVATFFGVLLALAATPTLLGPGLLHIIVAALGQGELLPAVAQFGLGLVLMGIGTSFIAFNANQMTFLEGRCFLVALFAPLTALVFYALLFMPDVFIGMERWSVAAIGLMTLSITCIAAFARRDQINAFRAVSVRQPSAGS